MAVSKVYCNSSCEETVSITGTLTGVIEPNRVLSFTPFEITFTSETGTHNYTFRVRNSYNVTTLVTFKNFTV